MKKDIYKNFETRQSQFSETAGNLKSLYTTLSWVRVLLFVGATIGVIVFADNKDGAAMLFTIAAAFVAYVALLKKHSTVRFELKLAQAREQINTNELKRMDNDLKEFEDGKKYYDITHPYHEDLDVFGKHSLFQLINRTSTFLGEKTLAQWLGFGATVDEIQDRQKSVQELSSNLDFRQDFEAYGKASSDTDIDHQPLLDWLNEDNSLKNVGLYKVALAILPAAMVITIVLSSLGTLQSGIPVLIGIFNLVILGGVLSKVHEVSKRTEEGYKSLNAMRYQIQMIENTDFSSPRLVHLKKTISNDKTSASQTIKSLTLILDNLQNRVNVFYIVLDILLLLDIFWYIKIVNWKNQNSADIKTWFETIGEIDGLSSVAGFTYSNPDFNFPSISTNHFDIEAEALGHPLIKSGNRVTNNFEFHGKGGICLITGSNMSGKSTFLRTVGVNCVLGLMGAPVCAEKMTVSPLNVFTSMRSQDDLEENVSSFYAELKRLKQLLASINNEIPILFMIDEVLKGTNSKDRHKGALALIKQLNASYAFGFVSTHDIELGTITNELKGVKNYSFNSEIIGDEIKFDYTLTPGICKSFNATKLMQKMGIDIPE
ncbi:MutS-related protein [Roseivirga sp.]|uniref:MutS-related protein n=1 Tax=Roseivirga sp. TaxID=1964215 RepID=UPI003B8DA7C4